MRALAICLGMGLLLPASCGGGNGLGFGGDGGTTISTGGCANQACLNTIANLMADCLPSGTCVEQITQSGTTGEAGNVCFSNGIKMSITMGAPSGASGPVNMSITAKKGTSVCYSWSLAMAMASGSSASESMTVKNASGATVATLAVDTNGNETITCPGGTPTPIDATCASASTSISTISAAGNSNNCTQGTCAF